MRRALVTGITGFTGRYVASELQQNGWEVWGLGLRVTKDAPPTYLQADLLDLQGLREAIDRVNPEVVVHLAGVASPAHAEAGDMYRANLLASRNLLAVLAESSYIPKCVLLVSSAYIYGNANAGVFTETSEPHPGNDYAVSKLAMEYMARLWMDRLPIVLIRPFNYTGIGQSESFLLSKIVGHFRRRQSVIELGNLDISRDFSDVRAVAVAYRRLLETCPAGEAVNVCSGKATSLRDILDLAQQISGHSIEVRVNPTFVRANDVRELRGDPTKLRSIIGQWDTPSLNETLRWMIQSEWHT